MTRDIQGRVMTYLKTVRCIETRKQLDDYKKLARHAMYSSTLQLGLLFVPLVLWFFGWVGEHLVYTDLLFVVIPSGLHFFVFTRYKELEPKAQAIPLDNQELLQEFIHVVNTWKKKSIPDW